MKSLYAYKRKPIALKFYQKFNDILQAINSEEKIKDWAKAIKQTLIGTNYTMLQVLLEYRNAPVINRIQSSRLQLPST